MLVPRIHFSVTFCRARYSRAYPALPYLCIVIISIHSEDDAELHFSATNCSRVWDGSKDDREYLALPHRRNNAKLLHRTLVVSIGPLFHLCLRSILNFCFNSIVRKAKVYL